MDSPGQDIPDFELIRRMADHEPNSSQARDAWSLFYIRHYRFLRRVCTSRHGYLLGLAGVKDLVQDAFIKAFDGAHTFNHANQCAAPEQELRCRGWLVAIAQNLVRDRYRGQPEVCLVDDIHLELLAGSSDGDPDQIPAPESDRLRLVKSGFGLLSDTEQTVLRATMLWQQADRQHQRMPESAMQQLSKETGKSPDTIRQIRLRALRKLEKYVNDNLDNEKAN
jgi:RNA polymerase sigma factor (sigma-70 family)